MARQIDHQIFHELEFTNELLLALTRTMVCHTFFKATETEYLSSQQGIGVTAAVNILEGELSLLHELAQKGHNARHEDT